MAENKKGYLVPGVDGNSTKEAEIAALRKMKLVAGEGSYLGMLFHGEFMEWVERKIRADFPPDLFQYWRDTDNHETQLILELAQIKETLEAKEKEHLEEVKKMEERGDYWETWAEKRRDERDRLEEMRNDLWHKLNEAENLNRQLEYDIIRLKAEIYDLKLGGKNG